MTMHSSVIGIDVAKDCLSLYRADLDQASILANEPRAIAAWLKGCAAGTTAASSATSVALLA